MVAGATRNQNVFPDKFFSSSGIINIMIKAILFDFAGVIVSDGYWLWLADCVPKLDEKREFFQKLSERGDAGSIPQDEFLRLLSEATGVPSNTIYPQIMQKVRIHNDLLHLVTRLRKNYQVGLITNYTYGLFDQLSKKYHLATYFDHILVSSIVGFIKPDSRFYQLMFNALNVYASECVYIDDRAYQVNEAKKLGMQSLLYSDVTHLTSDLSKQGINT